MRDTFSIPRLLLFVVVLLLSTSGQVSAACKAVFGGCKGRNVLLITLDTLRADRLPAYGYTRVKTPHLDQLADESFVFENAFSHVPLTLPSHASILTGLLPLAHGVRDNGGFFLDQKEMTLAEILKDHGYDTGAFLSAFVLDSRWQLNQGFDFYYDYFNLAEFRDINPRDVQRKGEETEIEAEHWLEAHKDRPFFSWVHFYDPHDPYEPPEPYKSEYSSHPYDGEIAYTDEVVGKLLKKLRDLGLWENTLIVLTGDHGENLGEHNEKTHALFVYEATQHVPLFICLPGGFKGRVPGIARHIDIPSTILELLGIRPLRQMQGMSLIPMMNGTEKTKRTAYSESVYAEIHYGWSPLQSITADEYRFIQAPRPELYDRQNDSRETHNLIQEKPDVAFALQKELQKLIASSSGKDLKVPQKIDPEIEEKLRALGYIGSTVQSTPESRKTDPKDKIHLVRSIQEAYGAIKDRDYATAVRRLKPVLKEDSGIVDAHLMAGVAYLGLEDYTFAVDELMKAVGLRPENTMALYNLGYAYQMMENAKEAEKWYLEVFKYEEKHMLTAIRLAHLYRVRNEPEKAKHYFLLAVDSYSESLKQTKSAKGKSALHATLGEIYFGADDIEQAEYHLKAAIQLTPDQPTVHYNLAQVYEAKGSLSAAAEEYKKETEVDPAGFKAFNNLGILYRQLNRLEEAVSCFQKVIELDPKEERGYTLLASTYKRLGKDAEADMVMKLAEERLKK